VEGQPEFATGRMVFVELCPYASGTFSLMTDQLAELAGTDFGFELAGRFAQTLLEEAEPALVLVNGNAAVDAFERLNADRLNWQDVGYESKFKEHKRLPHRQGRYRGADGRHIPVAGFPFLKTARGHNGAVEYQQLGSLIRQFIDGSTSQ